MFNLNNKKKRIIAAIIVGVLILSMLLSLVVSVAVSAAEVSAESAAASSSIVRNNIRVNGESVSGLDREQLAQKISEIEDGMKKAVITVCGAGEGRQVTVSAGNLGFSFDSKDMISEIMDYGHGANVIVRYEKEKDLEANGADFYVKPSFDRDKIKTFIENNCLVFDQPAVNASLHRSNGVFTIEGGQDGFSVDPDTSADNICRFLSNDWNGTDASVDLSVTTQKAQGDSEELSKVKDVLGGFTTYYSTSNAERKQNIANGCSLINGTTLYPGEEFSVLKKITPFTEENGYALAGSYLGDEVVESFGGGICQVSTTLYNAVIRAELQVTARSNHSMIVGYVDPSADAAIAESAGMDFKFVNNTDSPIYIAGYADGGQITFNIYGVETRDPGRSISFVSETLTTTPSEGVKVKKDASQPIGYVKEAAGHTGYTAQLWKVVTQNGTQVSKEVFNHSTYNMTPVIVTVGTAGTMTDELQAAIDSADVSKIKTAAENAKNGVGAADENSDLADEAQQAAQDAYAESLANGEDTAAAQQAAQDAADQVVAEAGQSDSQQAEGGSE